MNKEYQFTYNEILYRDKMQLLYDLSQKLNKSRSGNYIVFLVMCAILGIAFLYFNAEGPGIVIGPLLLLTGVVYFVAFANYLIKSKQYKAFFKKELETTIQRLNASGGLVKFAFSDDDFYYWDNDYESRIKWDLIQSYLLFDTHLFLLMDNGSLSGFTVSAFDLSPSEFAEICDFVKTKLPPHYLTPMKQETPKSDSEILDN